MPEIKMTEIIRIQSSFAHLYDGNNWIDITITTALAGINHKQAAKRYFSNSNSIWEITNHIIQWRKNVLKRLSGKTISTPAHNYFERVKDKSAKAWEKTLKDLDTSQKSWMTFLHNFKESAFDKMYASGNLNYYEHIQGIIQHDAYHLGQIVMLSKYKSKI